MSEVCPARNEDGLEPAGWVALWAGWGLVREPRRARRRVGFSLMGGTRDSSVVLSYDISCVFS